MTTYSFELKDNDLICNRIGDQVVDFKIGELFGIDHPVMEVENDLNFLNQIHRTNLITQELLITAQQWWQKTMRMR